MEKHPQFLPEKYPDLAGSKPVERAVQQARQKGEAVPDTKADRVEAYLERLQRIGTHERGFELLKQKILDTYITDYGEIPESYWKAQEAEARKRGESGDWEGASAEQREEVKRKHAEAVLSDQRASLEQWVDYFGGSDSNYIPHDLKYWIFRNILSLKELIKTEQERPDGTKEQHIEFPKRSKGTVSPFPDLNHEALSYVVDAVQKKLGGEGLEFEHDIGADERAMFLRHLEKEDFAKLYAWANELHNPIPEHLLPVTEGNWVKYPQGSDAHAFVKTIRGRGTGWCTAGENTAKIQLQGGDFYVYYSNDDEGKPTVPRLAIRMEGEEKIAEDPRGVAYKQNLDPYMAPILEEKLKEFGPAGEAYKKKSADMKLLTAIEQKTKASQPLTKADLLFLYEIDGKKIEGFGYRKDPRVKEIRDRRNSDEDMLVVFECTKDQIARRPDDITEHTKVYVGPIDLKGRDGKQIRIFDRIGHLEHIYNTRFPEGRISRYETELGGRSKADVSAELKDKNIYVYDWANQLIESPQFTVLESKERADLVRLTVADLGFPSGATTEQIYEKAKKLGLELCPPETGPRLRLFTDDHDYMLIAMTPITDRDGYPRVFNLNSGAVRLELFARSAEPELRWYAGRQFVFLLRKRKL